MTTRAELHEIVDQLNDHEAEEMLETLRQLREPSYRLDQMLATAQEVEPDALDLALLEPIRQEDLDTAIPLDDDFKRRLGITKKD